MIAFQWVRLVYKANTHVNFIHLYKVCKFVAWSMRPSLIVSLDTKLETEALSLAAELLLNMVEYMQHAQPQVINQASVEPC